MSFQLGDQPVDATVYCYFNSYDSNQASVTITGLAKTDIEIYKDGSTSWRESDNGYTLLDTLTLSRESWVEGYYDVLEPRAQALKDHEDASVRAFAEEALTEIEVFDISQDSYGYVFFVLQRP